MKEKSNCSLPPGIEFCFAACHLPLSLPVDIFQLLVDSWYSKHFIDPELIREIEKRILDYKYIYILPIYIYMHLTFAWLVRNPTKSSPA